MFFCYLKNESAKNLNLPCYSSNTHAQNTRSASHGASKYGANTFAASAIKSWNFFQKKFSLNSNC